MVPTRRVLLLLLGPMLLAAIAVAAPEVAGVVWIVDLALLALLVVDALSLPRRKQLTITREGGHNLSVGTTNNFALIVRSTARRPIRVDVIESMPDELVISGLPASGWVPSRGSTRFGYQIVPKSRGAFEVGRTYVRAASLLGLWKRQIKLVIEHPLKVFPDVKALGKYALLARRNRIDLLGFRLTRGRGSDVEFDRLREYTPDDDYRRIDALASARKQKLITRQYQVSRNQNVFFVIDCGRLMASESGGLSNLDHALNATLMLSALAVDLGDNVGLLAFDQTVRTFLPVAGGPRRKTQVLHALYDLHVSEEEADFDDAFITLQKRVRQRSLVVMLTNVMDAASFELLRPHLKALTRRHLPLVLLLRDEDLFDLAESRPSSVSKFYEVGAAAELATWREHMASHLSRMGALVLDVTPSMTTPELINSYLRIKAEQLL
ncbi:MAG: DUF58 domain-containing protein [Myxococcales bacterium]|nr:DUF58 domain-containing protein [Myxococcales bacterium]